MTLEQYIRHEYEQGKIDFTFRATVGEHGVQIYVHPAGREGLTTPTVLVKGNCVILPEGWAVVEAPRLER